MDPRFQTSFIPKKPIVSTTSSRSSSTVNLLTLVSTIIFVTTLALSGAAFFYKGIVAKQIESDKQTLERARGSFDPELIEQITRLDTRIETARTLLASHISVNPLFDFISTITLPSVRFRDFDYSYLSPEKISISMTGQARNYASVALQSDVLNAQKNLKEVTIGDMSLSGAGDISFSVSATVDPKVLLYSATLTTAPAQVQAQGAASTSTSTASTTPLQ